MYLRPVGARIGQFPQLFLFAARNDAVDIAKLLLKKASSEEERQKIIKYCDPNSLETALHCSATKNHFNFTKFLLSIIDANNEILTVRSIAILPSSLRHLLYRSVIFRLKTPRRGTHLWRRRGHRLSKFQRYYRF